MMIYYLDNLYISKGAFTSFIVNEIKLMRTLKTTHGEETCKKLGLFIYHQRRQMKGTVRAVRYTQGTPHRANLPPHSWGRKNWGGVLRKRHLPPCGPTDTFSVLL